MTHYLCVVLKKLKNIYNMNVMMTYQDVSYQSINTLDVYI